MNSTIRNLILLLVVLAIIVLLGVGIADAAVKPKKVNICHATSSEKHPWEAIRINQSAYDTHIDEHGDFDYDGPVKENGQPTKRGNLWCEENVPKPPKPPVVPPVTPPVTPTPPAPVVEEEPAVIQGK